MWEWRFRIFNHPWNRSPMLAIRDGQWKLLMNPDRTRVELYDAERDPGEALNVAAAHRTSWPGSAMPCSRGSGRCRRSGGGVGGPQRLPVAEGGGSAEGGRPARAAIREKR
jgi:hypothetical protein